MTLDALLHLLRSAAALADDRQFIVLGSASLLVSFPELGAPDQPLASTYDADICPEPFDELTGVMLDEAMGENRAYFQRHGYHADILRASIFETLPMGWRERVVAVPGIPVARALDPHDLAAVKLAVGRPKDLALVRVLAAGGRIHAGILSERLAAITMDDRTLARSRANLLSVSFPGAEASGS